MTEEKNLASGTGFTSNPRSARRHNYSSILMVEDDPFWQRAIENFFVRNQMRQVGLKVNLVATAEEAMDLIMNSAEFDLIISDQRLAGAKTGVDFWRMCQVYSSQPLDSAPLTTSLSSSTIREPLINQPSTSQLPQAQSRTLSGDGQTGDSDIPVEPLPWLKPELRAQILRIQSRADAIVRIAARRPQNNQ